MKKEDADAPQGGADATAKLKHAGAPTGAPVDPLLKWLDFEGGAGRATATLARAWDAETAAAAAALAAARAWSLAIRFGATENSKN